MCVDGARDALRSGRERAQTGVPAVDGMAQSKESPLPVEKVFGSEDPGCCEDKADEHRQSSPKGTFKIDSAISCKFSNGRSSEEAELTPWDGGDCDDEGFDLVANSEANGWDANEMFLKNKVEYGVRTSFQPSLEGYTVQLQKEDTPEYRNAEQKATEVANEILSNPRRRSQMECVNGEDEEDCHAAVLRAQKPQYGSGKYPPGNKTKTFRPTPPSTPPESMRRTTSPGGRGYVSRGYHHPAPPPPAAQGAGGRGYYPRHYYHPNHHPQGPYEPARGTPPPAAGRPYGPRPCGYHNTQPPQKPPAPPTPPVVSPHAGQGQAPPAAPQPAPLPQREPRVNGLERRRHQPSVGVLASPSSEPSPCPVEQEEMQPAMEHGGAGGDEACLAEHPEVVALPPQPPVVVVGGPGHVERPDEGRSPEEPGCVPHPQQPVPYVPQQPALPGYHPQYQQLPRPHLGQPRPYRGPRPAWRPQVPRFAPQPYPPPPQHDGFPLPAAVCNTGQPPVVQVPLIAASPEVPAAIAAEHGAKKQRELEEMKNFSQEFKLSAVDQEVSKEPSPPAPPVVPAASPQQPVDEVAAVSDTLHKSTLNPNAKEFVYNPDTKPVVNVSNERQPPSTPASPGQRTPQYTPSPGVPTPMMPPYVAGGQREAMFAYQNNSRAGNRFRRYQGPGVQPRPAALPMPAMHVAAGGGQSLVPIPSALQVPFPLPYGPQQLIQTQPYQQLVSVVADHGGAAGMLPLQPAAVGVGYFPDLQQHHQHHHHHPSQQPPPPPPPPPQVLCALPAQHYQFPQHHQQQQQQQQHHQQQHQQQRRQQQPPPYHLHEAGGGQPPPPPAVVPWIRPVLPPGMQPHIFHHHHHHHQHQHPHHQQQ